MVHWDSSLSYSLAYQSTCRFIAENAENPYGLRANFTARITLPSKALFALCEAIISAVSCVLVSLTLLVPCWGFEARKQLVYDLGKRAGHSTLACGIGITALFSPWIAVSLFQKCLYQYGWIPGQLRHQEAAIREPFLACLPPLLQAIRSDLLLLTPQTEREQCSICISRVVAEARDLDAQLRDAPSVHFTLKEQDMIARHTAELLHAFGPQTGAALQRVSTTHGVEELVSFQEWNALGLEEKLHKLECLAEALALKMHYEKLVEDAAWKTYQEFLTAPYIQRLEALTGEEFTYPERLSSWILRRSTDSFATSGISSSEALKETLSTEEFNQELAMQVEALLMEEALARAWSAAKRHEKSLDQGILESLPEEFTLDHLNNGLHLLNLLEKWRQEIKQVANEQYKLKVKKDWVEQAVHILLLVNLGELDVVELLSLPPEEFMAIAEAWIPASEHKEVQELCTLANVRKKRKKEAAREKVMDIRAAQAVLAEELQREIPDRRLVQLILHSLTDDRLESQIPTVDDLRRKHYSLQELKFRAVRMANHFYLEELKKSLKSLGLDNIDVERFLRFAIPRRILNGDETLSEHYFKRCISQGKGLVLAQRLLDGMRIAEVPYDRHVRFEQQVGELPPVFQKILRQEYNTLRCQFLADAARSELQFAATRQKLADYLSKKTPTACIVLDWLGLSIQSLSLDLRVCRHYFSLFQDARWARDVPPELMKDMLADTLERLILLSPKVHASLNALAEDAEQVEALFTSSLTPRQIGLVSAAMLLRRKNADALNYPDYAFAEAHRIMSVMLGYCPQLAHNLLKNRYGALILPANSYLTDLPMFQYLSAETEDGRDWKLVRGISSSRTFIDGWCYCTFGEEALLGQPTPLKSSRYQPGLSVAVHEWWHHMFTGGMTSGTAPSGTRLTQVQEEIKTLFTTKRKQIRAFEAKQQLYPGWRFSTGEMAGCSYASSNEDEWGAEFATSFLEANGGLYPKLFPQKRISSKEALTRLGKEERQMAKLYGMVLGPKTMIPFTNPWTPKC